MNIYDTICENIHIAMDGLKPDQNMVRAKLNRAERLVLESQQMVDLAVAGGSIDIIETLGVPDERKFTRRKSDGALTTEIIN